MTDGLTKLLSSSPFEVKDGDYAELADESDEQGLVVIRRKNGQMVATMPRDVWDALQGEKQ